MIIESLSLEGHDSELFSFLDDQYIEELRNHSLAGMALWSFGSVNNGNQLTSIPMWNTDPMCFAWTYQPNVENYRGYVTNDSLLQVRALVLLRQLFSCSYTCSLDGEQWIEDRADLTLERLKYIRGWGECSINSPEWMILQATYFDWMLNALNKIHVVAFS